MTSHLTVYILSDSLGETADQVAKAALTQFPTDLFHVVRLPRVSTRGQLQGLVAGASEDGGVVLYTLAAPKLRDEMVEIARTSNVTAIDILGPAVTALELASGSSPAWEAGLTRKTDRGYFERIEALEFAVKHDDGRNAEGLKDAEIVLIGVSRTSKTPLSMYLAFKGYRVANVPLATEMEPPHQLFDLDNRRVFGLTTEPGILVEIRKQRMAELGTYARRYADEESVESELDEARTLMRRLGCIVLNTGGRAIEETAQEILRYLEQAGLLH
jgi:[pyruvate, water dikinase]-phosphate phosphotransferase / [pyruvate, water dikinase] kinase